LNIRTTLSYHQAVWTRLTRGGQDTRTSYHGSKTYCAGRSLAMRLSIAASASRLARIAPAGHFGRDQLLVVLGIDVVRSKYGAR